MTDANNQPMHEQEHIESGLSIQLSGVKCLPDFRDNLANTATTLKALFARSEAFLGDKTSRILEMAKIVGESAVYMLIEGSEDYTE